MSYESEVLADTPVVYYRLDQLGFGVNGETVPDLSGNALDATLVFTSVDQPCWGHTSPIETDASSREFWGWTNGGGVAYNFTGESRIERASDALMAPSPKDFTHEQWLTVMAEPGVAGTFATSNKQGTGGIAIDFSGGWRITAFCFDSAATLYLARDMSFRISEIPEENLGVSFHCVAVRSGDALALYVNGTLRTITTVTSGLPTLFNSSPFRIQASTGIATNFRHDEVAYYNYALSPARILIHYEAALNALNMSGEANLNTTARLDGSDDPDPIAYPFRHNWTEPVIERYRWRSGVFRPTNGSYELTKQRSAPRRQVEYTHLLYTEKLRRQFEARAFGGQTAKVQLEQDKVRVGDLVATDTSATGDFTYMRFEVGAEVLVYQDDDHFEYATLTGVSDSELQFTALVGDYTAPWLKPVRVARLPVSQDMDAVTDVYGDSSTIYDLLEQDELLEPRGVTPWVSTLTYRDREMFDLREWQGHDYSEIPTIVYDSDRLELDDGTGVVTTKSYKWGAQQLQPYNMNLQGREVIAKYLGWLYERAGQYSPFWMPTFRQDLKPLSRTGVTLRVEGNEYTQLYASSDTRIDLVFVYFDNTVITRRIESAVANGQDDLLQLDSTVPTFTDLRWLCFNRRVILSSDDVEIAWHTDDVVRVAFAVIDAPLDFALGSPSVSPSPSPSGSRTLSPSASRSLSQSPSGSPSPSPSVSPTISPSASKSPSASGSPSVSPSISPSASTSISPSSSVSPSGSVSPSSSPSPTPSESPSQSPSASKSPSSSLSPSSSTSPSKSPSSSLSPSASPSPS